jgi:topoisomerase-4 subunit B
MNDLFGSGSEKAASKSPARPVSKLPGADSEKRLPLPARDDSDYSAKDIEVLEGLEPVRKRPGMYIGGTDEAALHHLAAEILDNAMDEAVAGHASFIEVSVEEGNWLTMRDNGRGIPVDPHPKFKNLSALEVILTTLHSGGKFGGKAYATSGGLHGVGSSVVNALSEHMEVEVARDRTLWKQSYAKGKPTTKLINAGPVHNRRGTTGFTVSAAPKPTCSVVSKSAGIAPRRC